MARQWNGNRPDTGIRILDCGADPGLLTAGKRDGYLLICGGKPWEWENSEEAASYVHLCVD